METELNARSVGPFARIFEEDPDLLRGVRQREAVWLARHVTVSVRSVLPGPWVPRSRGKRPLILMVLNGFMMSRLTVAGRTGAGLVGPGDVVLLEDASGLASVPQEVAWKALTPMRVAILDEEFLREIARWPEVSGSMMARFLARTQSLALQIAVAQLRTARARILVYLWHLTDRWGRDEDEKVAPVALSHADLAKMVCLGRQATTTALNELLEDGSLERQPDVRLALRGPPPSESEDVELNPVASAYSPLELCRPSSLQSRRAAG